MVGNNMKIYILILTLLVAGCWKEVQPTRENEFWKHHKAHPTKEFYECKRDVIARYILMSEHLALKYEDAIKSCDWFLNQ